MLDVRFRPVEQWPGKPRTSYRESQFKASYIKTLDLLERELAHLHARNIVIEAYFDLREIRNDGWPKSSARPRRPGLILSFESPRGRLSFPCDTYSAWEDNLRAIGLSLEALRAVDRHGVTQNNEQYKGWQQIAAPGATAHFQNAEAAADFIILQSRAAYGNRQVVENPNVRKEAYRSAAYHLHPDRGGNAEQFHLLQEALAVLEAGRAATEGGY